MQSCQRILTGIARGPKNLSEGDMANEAVADQDSTEDELEEGAEGEENQEGAAKKSKLKLMIIAGVALVVIIGATAGAYFMFFSGGSEEGVPEVIAAPETFFYDLPVMTVNLSSVEGKEQFLKLSVALEVASEEMASAIEPRVARVIDAFQVYLRELRRSDLEGSAGIYRLKEELRRRVNLALYPVQVDSILFKEILVQ